MKIRYEKMERGRGQLLQRYRPDETFDHEGHFIARVVDYRADRAFEELDREYLIEQGMRFVRRWRKEGRSAQPSRESANNLPPDTASAAFYDVVVPSGVYYAFYPLTVTCGNPSCRRVYEVHQPEPGHDLTRCPRCNHDPSFQLQYLLVHGCGYADSFRAPRECANGCREGFRLDTQASRFRDFRWLCIRCGAAKELTQICNNPSCHFSNKMMQPEVHTSGAAYVPQSIKVVNPPPREDRIQKQTPEYRLGVVGRWLNVCTDEESASLLSGKSGAIEPAMREMIETLRELDPARAAQMERKYAPLDLEMLRRRIAERLGPEASDDEGLARLAIQLENYEYTMRPERRLTLQSIRAEAPSESRRILYDRYPSILTSAGFDPGKLALVPDFPVVELAIGYSRAGYTGRDADLRPYSSARARGQAAKATFYAHPQLTEALVFGLEPGRVARWLDRNHLATLVETGGADGVLNWFARYLSRRGEALEWIEFETPPAPEDAAGDAVVRLMHSMAHQFIRALSVDSGYMETSLSEHFFPYHFSFATYPRANGEFVIGGLRTVLEQNLDEVVNRALDNDLCLYDPNCMEANRGADHGCLFLPETACSFRNRNIQLSRWELFGSPQGEVTGYWDPALAQ